MDFQPPKKMKLPRGSGAQAPSPAFGRGFCKVVSRESFARSRGRLRSLVPKGLAGDFRQGEVEKPIMRINVRWRMMLRQPAKEP